MKPIRFFLCFIFLVALPCIKIAAQNTVFISEGKIEFEKKMNLYSQMDEDNAWSELEKKMMPKFKTTYFELVFKHNKTLYLPGKENPDNNKLWYDGIAQENVIFSELDSSRSISQKKVFEQVFLIEDSTRKIQWKITDEIKTIAGFQCRRANAIIMDSIYVVAFYTDDIVTSGGPESFTGLPGMILGVSLPHQHVSWFATKISAKDVTSQEIKIPAKGKKVTNSSLKEMLNERMKDSRKYAQQNLQAVML
jgi:GLPGLI family protein